MVNMHNKMSLSKAMNARIMGSGKETMILAHGYGGDQSVWDKVLSSSSSSSSSLLLSFKILVFDWSFSGAINKDLNLFDASKYSCYDAFADDLIALLEELNFKSSSPSIFVGHSMSGIIGCIASLKRPDLFSRLVMVSSSPRYYFIINMILYFISNKYYLSH